MQTEIESTLKWAKELSEAWVGTTTGNIIEAQKKHLEYLVSSDMNLASIQVLELIETCKYAQGELDEH